MKKFLSLLCVCTLTIGLFAGCAKQQSQTPSTTSGSQTSSEQPGENKITLSDGTVYPSEPINILCGWAPGGNSDLMCQLLSAKIKETIGVDSNVSYMEGGDGTVALGHLANNTEADGYTLALCASGQFSIKPFTQDVSYDIDDFAFTPGAAEESYCIFVNKETGLETLDDLVEYYKANPDKTLHYGMSGANGIPHLSTSLVWDELGLSNTQCVSYDGGSTALAACLGGEVEAICVVASIGQPSYEAGDLNAIVMLTGERLESLPDVKTLGEYGYETISAGVKKSYVLPAETDEAIVEFLSEKFAEIYKTQEWLDFLAANTCNPLDMSGSEYKEECIDKGEVFWDLLEEQGLIKEGAQKSDFFQ